METIEKNALFADLTDEESGKVNGACRHYGYGGYYGYGYGGYSPYYSYSPYSHSYYSSDYRHEATSYSNVAYNDYYDY
jgi:hypothetical protein